MSIKNLIGQYLRGRSDSHKPINIEFIYKIHHN